MCPQPPLDSMINPCLTAPAIAAYVTGSITVLINSFLIIVILRTRRKKLAHYLLMFFILAMTLPSPLGGALAVLAGNPQLAFGIYKVATIFGLLFFNVFFWFVSAFLKIRKKWIIGLSIVHAVILVVIYIFSPGAFLRGVHWNGLLGYYEFEINSKSSWFQYFGFIFWFWSLGELIYTYYKSRSIIERNRLKYLIVGTQIFLVGGILVTIPATHIFPFDMVGATIASILLTYAVLRYKLLDITIVIRKGVLYSILTTVVTGVYVLFSLLFQFLLQSRGAPISFPAIISTALVVALIFQPLQRGTQQLIDRIFLRRKYDPQKLLARLSQTLSETLNLNILTAKFIDILCEKLQIEGGVLFLVNREKERLEVQRMKNVSPKIMKVTIRLSSPLIKLLSESDEVRPKHTFKEKDVSLEGLEKFNLELFVPLRSHEKLKGVLVLGPKLSGELYSLEELDLLETIADSATLALDNASLFTQLAKEKEKVEEAGITLERKVQDRTRELKQKADELGRINKVMVGRELKMVEMKKKIAELKGSR